MSKLTRITPLKIEFSVNESQAYDVRPGAELWFTTVNDLKRHRATVYAVEPRIDESMMTVMIRAIYPNPGGVLKPGHSANIELNLRRYENTIVVPSMAIVAEMGRDLAFVYEDGKARRVEIKKGIRTESSLQVLEGLHRGDTLITSGVMQLRDGMSVKLGKLTE